MPDNMLDGLIHGQRLGLRHIQWAHFSLLDWISLSRASGTLGARLLLISRLPTSASSFIRRQLGGTM